MCDENFLNIFLKMCGDGNDRVVVEMTGCCGNDNELT